MHPLRVSRWTAAGTLVLTTLVVVGAWQSRPATSQEGISRRAADPTWAVDQWPAQAQQAGYSTGQLSPPTTGTPSRFRGDTGSIQPVGHHDSVDWDNPANWTTHRPQRAASSRSSVPAIAGSASGQSASTWPSGSPDVQTAYPPQYGHGSAGTASHIQPVAGYGPAARTNALTAQPGYIEPGGTPPTAGRSASMEPRNAALPPQWPAANSSPEKHPRSDHPITASRPDNVSAGGSQAIQSTGVVQAGGTPLPRNRVISNEWHGPTSRPVSPIRQISYDAIPDSVEPVDATPQDLLMPYAARATTYPDRVVLPVIDGQLKELPQDYAPWWDPVINRPMRVDLTPLNVDVETLILKAIEHSPQVTAMRIDPIIRELTILEEEAQFDWATFLESTYDDASDPVGNSLTTGGAPRFNDHRLVVKGGLKKKFDQGAEIDISQRGGYQDNNSTFFTPTQQATSRLEVNFTQPLLKGAGDVVNQSRIVQAMLDHDISQDELATALQDHLVAVYEAYWTLYRARAVRLQKERLLRRAQQIQQHLEARQGVDSIKRQVLRARAAVASRRSEIVRADMAIRNAEARLRLLVNSPDLKEHAQVEVLPAELPMSQYMSITLRGSIETALTNRPDISQSIHQMKVETLRLGVSKNELLPKLDLVLGVYNSGLRGAGNINQAYRDQYSKGEPGFSVGLFFEYPLGNRAAQARYAKREWELAKSLKEFEASVEIAITEVELSVRELETSYQEMLSRFQAMAAAETEADYLLERWRLLPGSDQTISFLLEDLLDAQERVATEEADFVDAQVNYVLAIVNLKRSSGILLVCNNNSALKAANSQPELTLPGPDPVVPVPTPLPVPGPNPAAGPDANRQPSLYLNSPGRRQ